jgi:hypothetical protein
MWYSYWEFFYGLFSIQDARNLRVSVNVTAQSLACCLAVFDLVLNPVKLHYQQTKMAQSKRSITVPKSHQERVSGQDI